jgi:membrane peptidoglycan carboxypeptidase
MTDVHGIAVTGGSLPAKIWAAYMKEALSGLPVTQFSPPASAEKYVTVDVCSESHLLPTQYCPKPESTDTPRGNRGQIEDKCLLFLGECELVEPTSTPRGRHSLDAIFPQSLSPVSSLL